MWDFLNVVLRITWEGKKMAESAMKFRLIHE